MAEVNNEMPVLDQNMSDVNTNCYQDAKLIHQSNLDIKIEEETRDNSASNEQNNDNVSNHDGSKSVNDYQGKLLIIY